MVIFQVISFKTRLKALDTTGRRLGASWNIPFFMGPSIGGSMGKWLTYPLDPSGKHTKSYWTWPFSSLIFPLKMVIFHSYVRNYQRVPSGNWIWFKDLFSSMMFFPLSHFQLPCYRGWMCSSMLGNVSGNVRSELVCDISWTPLFLLAEIMLNSCKSHQISISWLGLYIYISPVLGLHQAQSLSRRIKFLVLSNAYPFLWLSQSLVGG